MNKKRISRLFFYHMPHFAQEFDANRFHKKIRVFCFL